MEMENSREKYIHTGTYLYIQVYQRQYDRQTYIIQKCALYTCVYAFVFLVHVPRYRY